MRVAVTNWAKKRWVRCVVLQSDFADGVSLVPQLQAGWIVKNRSRRGRSRVVGFARRICGSIWSAVSRQSERGSSFGLGQVGSGRGRPPLSGRSTGQGQ